MNILNRTTFGLSFGLLIMAAGCSDDDSNGDPPPDGATSFTLRLENVSGSGPLPGPISPGVALAHTGSAPLFTSGMPDRGEGLAAIAEDGDPSSLAGCDQRRRRL